MVNFFYFSYLGSKQFRPGIEYLDSLNNAPFLQQHCKHELLSTRASLHQMCGDNEAAIRLADEYLQLPEYDDADRYIPQAEIVSGVYIYSGNDIPQAIRTPRESDGMLPSGREIPQYAPHHISTGHLLPPDR